MFISFYLVNLDFVYRRTRGSPKLSVADKAFRYHWRKNNEKNNFRNYLLADASTVRVLEDPLYHKRKKQSATINTTYC